MSAPTRSLIACGFGVPVLFLGVLLAEGALRPGYAPLHRFGSELALGDRGWVMTANFIATGALVLAFSAGLRRSLKGDRGGAAAPLLAAVFGLCLIAGGVFTTDPKPGYPPGAAVPAEPTLHGALHDANPVPFYLSLIALVCVLARRFAAEPGGRPWAWYSAATAVAVPVTFAAAAALAGTDGAAGAFHGLWQRINLAIGLGWFAAAAYRLLRAGEVDAPQRSR